MFHRVASRQRKARKEELKNAFRVKDVTDSDHVQQVVANVQEGQAKLPWQSEEEWLKEYDVTEQAFKDFNESILSLNAVVTPYNEPAKYEEDRKEGKDFNHTFPWAIVYVCGVADVETTIKFALALSRPGKEIPMCIRSGGHCYNGYSVLQKGIVIDFGTVNDVTVAPDLSTVTVGPGCRFKQLYQEANAYGLVVPGGTCPDVAMGGFIQGGGFGYLTRKFGPSCDSLIGLTLVTVNQHKQIEVKLVNEKNEPDLLWAHRGGTGGNYGVVTSLTFKPHQLPDPKNVWGMSIIFPDELATDVFLAWQKHYTADPNTPDPEGSKNFSSFFNLTWMDTSPAGMRRRWNSTASQEIPQILAQADLEKLPPGGCIEIDGIYPDGSASKEQVWNYFKPLLDVYKLSKDSYWQNPKTNLGMILQKNAFPETSAWLDDAGGEGIPDTIYEQTRCAYSNNAWSADDFNEVYNFFKSTVLTNNITLESYGGQVNQTSRTATAFVHRSAYFDVVVEGCWGSKDDHSNPPQSGAFSFIDNAFDLFNKNNLISQEVYQNYPTADRYHFPLNEVLNSYFAENLARLQTIKSKYNPLDLYRYPQGVETTPSDGAKVKRKVEEHSAAVAEQGAPKKTRT